MSICSEHHERDPDCPACGVTVMPGVTYLCEIPDGAKIRAMPDGTILVAHPDHAPFVVHPDGTKEEIVP